MKMATWKVFAYLCIVLYMVSKNMAQLFIDVCDSPENTYDISQILLTVYKGNSSYNSSTSSKVSTAEILEKEIDPEKDTVFYTHGFTDDPAAEVVKVVINAYLDRGDVNLIVGDWSNIAKNPNYAYVSSNVRGVGMAYAQAINKLANVINFSTFHVAGHSLGAHIGGFIGRSLNRTLNRLTGLDPAFPLFYPSDCHISPTDADLVVILHTDKGALGTPFDTGSVDFLANKGTNPQPGCGLVPLINDRCSHQISTAYFAESLRQPTAFPAYKCSNGAIEGTQNATQIYFGDSVPKDTRGDYCFNTSANPPYTV